MTVFAGDDELTVLAERRFRQIDGHILVMPIRIHTLDGVNLIATLAGRVQLK